MWGWGFILLGLLVGCGSDNAPISEKPSPLSIVAPSADPAEKLITGEGFDGALVIEFDAPSSSAINNVQTLAEQSSLTLRRLSEANAEDINKRRRELERLSGKQLEDFNRFYAIDIADAETARELYRKLKDHAGITRLYPRTKVTPTSLANTPDLTPHQNYLLPHQIAGGLNIHAAWNRGVRGQGVWLVDHESGWSLNHEDLPLRVLRNDLMGDSPCTDTDPSPSPLCPAAVAHGTAMVGIMGGLDNAHGITGVAPDAVIKGASASGGLGLLGGLTDGTPSAGELPAGSIFAVIFHLPGALNPDGFCSATRPNGRYGCVTAAADPALFSSIEQATAAGVTVIVGAGNGSISLDRDDAYQTWQHNLNVEDTSAILVGGADVHGPNGSLKEKIEESNCGRQVSLFAWGRNVTTTAYPAGDYRWYGTTPPIPPNDSPNAFFVDVLGGTSTATAMVAGAAALVQSHAKQQMAPSGAALTRYLMSHRIKQLLVDSGVPQTDGGCNIGHQPDVGVALNLFDQFWNRIRTQYPELTNNTQLTEERMLTLRRQEGIGLLCGRADAQQHRIVGDHDPSCPEQELWPTGNYIAKNLDFDGDGRADLVSATNGEWKLDLSSRASTTNAPDNFGSWDVTITFPRLPGKWVWPYTEDMNSDGRSDLVVYDKENGKWYIEFTTTELLNGRTWDGWDFQVDYSTSWHDTLEMDPWQSKYSRPHPGDYNADGLIDIAIACSDGMWRIDYQNEGTWDGVFDREVRYLDDQRLRDAPGWAYLTGVAALRGTDHRSYYITYKVPDGLPEEGKLVAYPPPYDRNWDDIRAEYGVPPIPNIFGGNEMVPQFIIYNGINLSFKNFRTGQWTMAFASDDFQQLTTITPDGVYGEIGCHPIVGDFDGDDQEERAVFCSDGWRFSYTSDTFSHMMESDELRHISLGYNSSIFSLPGRSYAGGLSYERVTELVEFEQRLHPNQPPPIPVDMATVSYIP